MNKTDTALVLEELVCDGGREKNDKYVNIINARIHSIVDLSSVESEFYTI